MATSEHTSGRRPVKQQGILEYVRGGVQSGLLAPGQRLPTRIELEAEFNCSSVTVQRAIEHLKEDGTVSVRGRLGTFISESPPGRSEYAIVFTLERGSPQWVRFWSIIEEQAALVAKERGIRFRFFAGIDGRPYTVPYRELLSAVESRQLAGVIYTSTPKHLAGSSLVDCPGLPMVAITGRCDFPNIATIRLDVLSFYDSAISFLNQSGCERVGFLIPPGHDPLVPLLVEKASRLGMVVHPAWVQLQSQATANWAAHQVELLLDRPPDDRPDGLIVGDDNLVDAAVDGIHSAGVEIPTEIALVAHCNFPAPRDGLEIARLGYHANDVLAVCLDMLEAIRGGEAPRDTVVKPSFREGKQVAARFRRANDD